MKYLYIIGSDSEDFYSEEAYISIFTLRQKMPDAFVVLLVDTQTSIYLHKDFPQLLEFANELKVVDVDAPTKLLRSRILKASMRQHIDGDFLFIDCDTVICEDLSEIEQCGHDIACVLDIHLPMCVHPLKEWITRSFKRCDFKESIESVNHFNSGVLYCKDNARTRQLFKDCMAMMLKAIDVHVYEDQIPLNQADAINGYLINELDGRWNCQLMNGGVKYLGEAKIIHYFTSTGKFFKNPYLIAQREVFQEVKAKRLIPEYLRDLLANPKGAISNGSILLSSDVPYELFFHQTFLELAHIYKKRKFLYKMLRGVCWLLLKFHK